MKNFVNCGDTVKFTAPYTVVAGAGALLGGLFGVAVDDVTSGAEGIFRIEGVFDLLCVATDTPAQGDPIYWDNSAKKATAVATGNVQIGTCLITKANGPTTVQVRLSEVVLTMRRGETALDGSNPTPVVTGLTTIISFVAMLKGTAAPGVGTSILTSSISSGTASVYAWKPTGAGDATLIASTGTESFYWVAVGV